MVQANPAFAQVPTRRDCAPSPAQPWVYAAFVGGCLAIGALGGLATSRGLRRWYPSLRKPAFTPPNRVFGPAWTSIYVLTGTVGYRLWQRRDRPGAQDALRLWGVQIAANAAWSPLFFGAKRPDLALADLAVMWAALAKQTHAAWRVDRPAALMSVPYLAWISFAAALNEEIWRLNRHQGDRMVDGVECRQAERAHARTR